MKSLIISILGCLVFHFAYGNVGFGVLSATVNNSLSVEGASAMNNPYKGLNKWFANGWLPTKEETLGWWFGRCFLESSPYRPEIALLVSVEIPLELIGTDVITENVHHLAIFIDEDEPADDSDEMSPEDEKQVERAIDMYVKGSMMATEEDGSLVSQYEDGNTKYAIRKYLDYFVSQSTRIKGRGGYEAGSVYRSCYFFKKVK